MRLICRLQTTGNEQEKGSNPNRKMDKGSELTVYRKESLKAKKYIKKSQLFSNHNSSNFKNEIFSQQMCKMCWRAMRG